MDWDVHWGYKVDGIVEQALVGPVFTISAKWGGGGGRGWVGGGVINQRWTLAFLSSEVERLNQHDRPVLRTFTLTEENASVQVSDIYPRKSVNSCNQCQETVYRTLRFQEVEPSLGSW